MAKAHITCQSCGTVVSVGTSKNRRDADRYAEYMESKGYLCDECLTKQREAENAKAAEQNAAAGLPELTGSESQIAWAETIRSTIIEEIRNNLDSYLSSATKKAYMLGRTREPLFNEDTAHRVGEEIISRISAQKNAAWWIDNRSKDPHQIMREFGKDIAKEFSRGDFTKEAESAKAEATVIPESEITATVAEITHTDNTITINLPEKIESFRLLMHDLGYRWKNNAWQRVIGVTAGTAEDRMAEAGNKTLALGIPVRIYNTDIRRKAIDADFEPEHKRWLTQLVSGEYAGWICIQWAREDDLYAAAKALPGARYHKPHVVVPADQYEALADLAEAHDFRISPGAQAAMDAAKAAHDGAVVAAPAAAPKAAYHDTGAMAEPTGDIHDELRDEDEEMAGFDPEKHYEDGRRVYINMKTGDLSPSKLDDDYEVAILTRDGKWRKATKAEEVNAYSDMIQVPVSNDSNDY